MFNAKHVKCFKTTWIWTVKLPGDTFYSNFGVWWSRIPTGHFIIIKRTIAICNMSITAAVATAAGRYGKTAKDYQHFLPGFVYILLSNFALLKLLNYLIINNQEER